MGASYRFVVTGRVQGVGYRASALRRAQSLGLRGWVRNRTDGAVEGIAAADSEHPLAEFQAWLGNGPPGARVDTVAWEGVDEMPGTAFHIRP
jgi:acylphosphatase